MHPGVSLAVKQNERLKNHCKWKLFWIFTKIATCSSFYSPIYIILKGTQKEPIKWDLLYNYTITEKPKNSTSIFVLNTQNSVFVSLVDVFYFSKIYQLWTFWQNTEKCFLWAFIGRMEDLCCVWSETGSIKVWINSMQLRTHLMVIWNVRLVNYNHFR